MAAAAAACSRVHSMPGARMAAPRGAILSYATVRLLAMRGLHLCAVSAAFSAAPLRRVAAIARDATPRKRRGYEHIELLKVSTTSEGATKGRLGVSGLGDYVKIKSQGWMKIKEN